MTPCLVVNGMLLHGILDTSQPGLLGCMARLEVEYIRVFGDGPGLLHEIIRDPAQFGHEIGGKYIFQADVAVFSVRIDLFLSQHLIATGAVVITDKIYSESKSQGKR